MPLSTEREYQDASIVYTASTPKGTPLMTTAAEIRAMNAELEAEGHPCPPELVEKFRVGLEILDRMEAGEPPIQLNRKSRRAHKRANR